jgi:hypothetical protein
MWSGTNMRACQSRAVTKSVVILVVALAAHVASAETTGQRRALELAQATLVAVERIDKSLQLAVTNQDDRLLREQVSIPLDQLRARWSQAPGTTDKDKFTHAGCINAAAELTSLRDTYIFRDPLTKEPASRRAYLRERYREELEQCKDSIRNPAKHYLQ